jgi:hypothetical protein
VQRLRPGSPLQLGLVPAVAGFLLAALTLATAAPWLLAPTAIVLGAGDGTIMVAGLSQVAALAGPDDLASVTAVFYCLTYLGFATPFVVTPLGPVLPASRLLLVAAAVVGVVVLPPASVRGRVPSGSPG